jgi:hypothetical protein
MPPKHILHIYGFNKQVKYSRLLAMPIGKAPYFLPGSKVCRLSELLCLIEHWCMVKNA